MIFNGLDNFNLRAVMLFVFLSAFNSIIVNTVSATAPPIENKTTEFQSTNSYNQFKPGDAVKILIYPDTTSFLHGTYPIDGEGYVFLPITGRVKISIMNEEQFIQYLNSSFTQYFRIPNIQIRRLIRISLLGGFNKPGLYYVDSNETLWYVMQLVGGTVDGKSLSELTWERNNEILNENLIPLLESGKSLHELGFKSGDQIWVERPDEPDILDKAVQIGTLLTATATLITIYLTFYTR